ncbi:PhnD/SsuA/transferrin family substrate-binding protein [Deltaproteobacteria bacterium TL4]
MFIVLLANLPLRIFAENQWIFGIASIISPEKNLFLYKDLTDYLSKRTHKEIVLLFKREYGEMNRLIENSKVHFASICTGSLLDLDPTQIRVIVVPEVRGKTTYQAFIITNNKVNIDSIQALRGKIFAFTDPLSNSGWLYSHYLLKKNGYSAENFFKKSYYTYSHDRSILLVNKGVVEAASVDSLVFEFMAQETPESVQNIKVIHRSDEFTAPPLVASTRLSQEEFLFIREIFLDLDRTREGKDILRKLKIDRFRVPPAKAFRNVLQMKKVLHETE